MEGKNKRLEYKSQLDAIIRGQNLKELVTELISFHVAEVPGTF